MEWTAMKSSIVVNGNTFSAPIIHINQITHTIMTRELLTQLQKDKRRKESCPALFEIDIYSNKGCLHSFNIESVVDDANAEEFGDRFVHAPISIPLPAMKEILLPTPASPHESNKVIVINKSKSMLSQLTTVVDSAGNPELALLDPRTFSTNGVLDEKLCRTVLITGAPIYSENGRRLIAISTPSARNPLACLPITSNFHKNHEKRLQPPSGRSTKGENTRVEIKEENGKPVAEFSKEGGAAPSLPTSIPTEGSASRNYKENHFGCKASLKQMGASKTGTSFDEDSFSVTDCFEQRNPKVTHPKGDEQQCDKQCKRYKLDYPRELEGRNRNLAFSTEDEENNLPGPASFNLSCGSYDLSLDSGYISSGQIQISGNVGTLFGELERPLFDEQQPHNQHHQPMKEPNQQPVNIEEPNAPPTEESKCRSANSPDRKERDVPNMLKPSSLSEDRRLNYCVLATLTNDQGAMTFCSLNECGHELKEADFNQWQELSLCLDKDTPCRAGWYTLSKQYSFINEHTRTQLNMAYFGGGCPAMSYLIYMSSTGPKMMTFSDLLNDLLKLEMTPMVNYMCDISESIDEDTLLCELPYNMLQRIATGISPKPQQSIHLQKTWKNLASLNKLKRRELEVIENSQMQLGLTSPSEQLLAYIVSVKPFFKLSELAKKLIEIKRIDVLMECSIFSQCIHSHCICAEQ